jgi:hypothetical protein
VPGLQIRITPEPSEDERTAIALALALRRARSVPAAAAERSAWWREGVRASLAPPEPRG